MSSPTKVIIYKGPPAWFREQVGSSGLLYLMDVVRKLDESSRHMRLIVDGWKETPATENADRAEQADRPEQVVAQSSDYASIQEHAIINFVDLVFQINPERLSLHNPPELVQKQLERHFQTEVKSFAYPVLTRKTLSDFRDGFSKRIVGQRDVREQMLAALYQLTTGRRVKPLSLMFYGPSGVGKTETARFVNELLGGELLRKQFSMFHSDKFASYLFGGAHSESSFARDLLDRSSGVVLIDEFDKANRIFHSAFYELFDEGIFTDKNYRVEVGPALIICTSNYQSREEIREALGDALFSRFDSCIRFYPLSSSEKEEVVHRILDFQFAQLSQDERLRLDRGSIERGLIKAANNIANVRSIGKVANELICLKLARTYLDHIEPSND